jgi:phage terminase large subunit-like protein
MLRYYSAVERRPTDRLVLSWDIALSEKEAADYSACVVLLNRGELYYVLEVIRGKFPFDKLKDKIIEVKARYERAALVIEEGGISHGLIQSLREKHINVVDIKPDRDDQRPARRCLRRKDQELERNRRRRSAARAATRTSSRSG